jgi:hypothetical protein
MHRDTTHRCFIGKSPPRPDASPSLAVVFAAHNALADSPDNDRYFFHKTSVILQRLERLELLERLERFVPLRR